MCAILGAVSFWPEEKTITAKADMPRRRSKKFCPSRSRPKEKPDSVAMIMVLDKSGSMGGRKIEMTKEAAKAPLALRKDTYSFGVVAFDYNLCWPVKFQTVANRSTITQAISTHIAAGETTLTLDE